MKGLCLLVLILFSFISVCGQHHGNAINFDGNWHHYAIIADKKQDGIVVYVDGVAVEFIKLYYYGKNQNI